MRLSQDKESIIKDISKIKGNLKKRLARIEARGEGAKHSQALKAWHDLGDIDLRKQHDYRELQSYRRQLMMIDQMQTSRSKSYDAYLKVLGPTLDRLESIQEVDRAPYYEAFNKLTELLPNMQQGEFRYAVLDTITSQKIGKGDADEFVMKIKNAYDRSLLKVGGNDENEILVQFAHELQHLNEKGIFG